VYRLRDDEGALRTRPFSLSRKMSNNAAPLSPFHTVVEPQTTGIDVAQVTTAPAPKANFIRIAGGPTTFSGPSLTLVDDAGTTGYLLTTKAANSTANVGEYTIGTFSSFTMSSAFARYAQTGPMVTVNYDCKWTNQGSATSGSDLRIRFGSGMPTASSQGNAKYIGIVNVPHQVSGSTVDTAIAYLLNDPGDGRLTLYFYNISGTTGNKLSSLITCGDLLGVGDMSGTFSYSTDDY